MKPSEATSVDFDQALTDAISNSFEDFEGDTAAKKAIDKAKTGLIAKAAKNVGGALSKIQKDKVNPKPGAKIGKGVF